MISEFEKLLQEELPSKRYKRIHNENNEILSFEFSLDEFFTENGGYIYQGNIGNKKMKISIYNGERDIPHCHVYNVDFSFHCCPCLDEAKYFIHTGKENKMNSYQRKDFDKIMSMKTHRTYGMTVWEFLVQEWNRKNEHKVTTTYKPDYKKMSGDIRAKKKG